MVQATSTATTWAYTSSASAEDTLDTLHRMDYRRRALRWYSEQLLARWTVQDNSAYRIEVAAAPVIGTLVSNTDQSVDGSANTLDTGNPKRAQAFGTGDNVGGYELGSIGIRFTLIDAGARSRAAS